MTPRRLLPVLALLSPFAVACSGSASETTTASLGSSHDGGGTSKGDTGASSTKVECDSYGGEPQLDTTTDSIEAAVERQAASFLDGYVGQFVRGEGLVYTGTVTATTGNDVAPGSPASSAEMNAASVFGSLVASPPTSTLTLFDSSQETYLVLTQSAGSDQTSFLPIFPYTTKGGNPATCTSCFPSLAGLPASIDVSSVSATGQTAYEGEVYANVTAQLTAVAPCSITYAELAAINVLTDIGSGASFQAEGPDMVWHMSSTYSDGPANAECSNQTPYTLDLYIVTATPWDFGVRNYSAGATTNVCMDP